MEWARTLTFKSASDSIAGFARISDAKQKQFRKPEYLLSERCRRPNLILHRRLLDDADARGLSDWLQLKMLDTHGVKSQASSYRMHDAVFRRPEYRLSERDRERERDIKPFSGKCLLTFDRSLGLPE